MERKQSPNYSRNKKNSCEYIVIHAMAGTYPGSIAWFMNTHSQVSAHYCVSQKGEVTQMLDDAQVGWHCYGLNSKSIGIETEDKGNCLKNGEWITPALWKATTELAANLCKKHSIPTAKIVPHSQDWIRKMGGPRYAHLDPGPAFDIDKFRKEVQALLDG